MFFSSISLDNQVKNHFVLFLTFRYLSLSSITPYIFKSKKIFVFFLHYNGEFYKIKTNAQGK